MRSLSLVPALVLAGVSVAVGCSSASPEAASHEEQAAQRRVAEPTFSPTSLTATAPFSLKLASTTPGAAICYTTDGATPTCTVGGACAAGSTHYTRAVAISAALANPSTDTVTVEAIACHKALTPSVVGIQTYAFEVAPPQFAPTSGTYAPPRSVTLTDATSGATICVTEDGSVPVCTNGICVGSSVTLHSGQGLTLGLGATQVDAVACHAGMETSVAMVQSYLVQESVATTPLFSPLSSTFTQPTLVTLSDSTPGAVICLTQDGTAPSCSSGICGGTSVTLTSGQGVTVSRDSTLAAVACSATTLASPPSFQVYAIQESAATAPLFSPTSGTYLLPITVTLSDSTAGAVICVTQDGTVPTCAAGLCEGSSVTLASGQGITVSQTGTVQAVACSATTVDSPVSVQTYHIGP